jgi:hypothetical protein
MGLPDGRHRTRTGCLALRCAVVLALLVGALSTWALAADAPPRQSTKEADQAMKQLMEKRHAVRGVTTRGKSIADAPSFKVVPRKPALTKYPCTSCHDNSFVDPRVRVLKEEHGDLVFEHGGGRFWCYDACHNGKDMDNLVSLRRRPIDYDRPYLLCGQCHFEKQKDWSFGGHGHRAGPFPVPRDIPVTRDLLRVADREKIGMWRGERVLLNCTACHNAHSPAIKPYPPSPPPQVRSGLTRGEPQAEIPVRVWESRTPEKGSTP